MIRSMTGFGQENRLIAGYSVQIDAKSVNHRYCEVVVRLPREWMALEDSLRRTVQQAVKRGRVDIFVSVERQAAAGKRVVVDWELAAAVRDAAGQLQDRFGFSKEGLNVAQLLQVPGLIRFEDERAEPDESLEQSVCDCLEAAIAKLTLMRETEGRHLHRDLSERLETLEKQRAEIAELAPQVTADYYRKLSMRVQELLNGQQAAVDPQRLAMEVALFADKCSVDEELTRLRSHFAQCGELLASGEPVGRKLDFLVQEMNREVNTIGSKANDADLTTLVVSMKSELEKIREQVQNVE